jgi:hypothetical protein
MLSPREQSYENILTGRLWLHHSHGGVCYQVAAAASSSRSAAGFKLDNAGEDDMLTISVPGDIISTSTLKDYRNSSSPTSRGACCGRCLGYYNGCTIEGRYIFKTRIMTLYASFGHSEIVKGRSFCPESSLLIMESVVTPLSSFISKRTLHL